MNIRLELQKKLTDWAKIQSPPIPVALENVPFVKPSTGGKYLEVYFLNSVTINPDVSARRERETGMMQINICVEEGGGVATEISLINSIRALYPVIPKTGTVSIERPIKASSAIVSDNGWRTIPLTVQYRQER